MLVGPAVCAQLRLPRSSSGGEQLALSGMPGAGEERGLKLLGLVGESGSGGVAECVADGS